MTDLYVFYNAHRKDGAVRVGNIVFRDCTAIATYDDIKDLENEIVKIYDYEDCKIQHWQRMESQPTPKPNEKGEI